MFSKSKAYRSKALLKFVRTLPCAITGKVGDDIDPHHITTGGTGMKGDDRLVVPLCNSLHREYHQLGRASFEKRYGVNMRALALRALMEYVAVLEERI